MIPDAISPEQLALLVGQGHLSLVIPRLRMGSGRGGPVDLAFAIDQLIRRSSGVNAVQIICAISFTLCALIRHYDASINGVGDRLPPFDDLPDDLSAADLLVATASLQRDRTELAAVLDRIDGVMRRLLSVYGPERMADIDLSVDDTTTEAELRSAFAISDELLEDLELFRSQIDSFLS